MDLADSNYYFTEFYYFTYFPFTEKKEEKGKGKERAVVKSKKRKKVIAILTCLILIFSVLCGTAYAETGKLTVRYNFDDVNFDVYHVASRQGDGTWQPTEKFGGYQINFETADMRDVAVTLSGYVIRDKVKSTASQKTSANQCSFAGLSHGLYLVMGESVSKDGATHTPVPALVEVTNANMTIEIKDESTPEEEQPSTVSCSVEKIWVGTGEHPQSITVQLIKDDTVAEEVVLSAEIDWCHTWDELDADHTWQVIEKKVPENYVVSIVQDNLQFSIINTQNESEVPDTPTTHLTVHKVWEDQNSSDRPKKITVQLLKNGEAAESIELTEEMQWTYTWENLDVDADWSVIETNIPKG